MRRALLSLIMAATVLSPIAAQAQDRGQRLDRGRATSEQRQAVSERRAQRVENRAQRQQARQAARADNREARQQVRQSNRQAQRSAVAQRQRGERGNRAGRPGSVYPQAWQGNPNDPALRRYQQLERQNQYRYGTREQRREIRREQRGDRRDWRQDRREDRRDWRRDRRDDRRDWRQDRRADRRDWRRDWDRRSWRNDRRYDWQGWRYRNRHIYRQSPYYAPYRNHRYSRFSVGLFLQPMFYNDRYWIGDPWQYRLPAAPAGTRWVRYYDDVILVDVYNGEVIDVIYDFFW
ncbi:RcnB family protein [Sphingosinicella sp. CPCC 101087]|uniref:RcnB family protein n=1 Tax=Sphingosinicella sp. CPCC 101087 TaxID=2497754 RepID=UPI00101BA489|nr:RcnB family protein [Sphingosinicella sp. CPCC 101087]